MPELSPTMKQQMLQQIKQNSQIPGIIEQVKGLIVKFDNVNKTDFKEVLPPDIYKDLCSDPDEAKAWSDIEDSPQDTLDELNILLEKIKVYITTYKKSDESHVNEAEGLMEVVRGKIRKIKKRKEEEEDWENLDKSSFSALIGFLKKNQDSIHESEIDELMWTVITTSSFIKIDKLLKYVETMPNGKHIDEARIAIEGYSKWEYVKKTGDIIEMKQFIDNNPESPFFLEAQNIFYDLKEKELENMKKKPAVYSCDKLQAFFNAGVFDLDELIREGLMTERSWKTTKENWRNRLPKIDQRENPNISAPEGSTDIFFFGTPSTGKTCLLMGLAGANGSKYTLEVSGGGGGKYVSDLALYVKNGITPGSTFGNFVTVIKGEIIEQKTKGAIYHPVNFIEMSGEEFAVRIADNDENEVSFENMGTGATRLLMNNNRKVFFIIVDPTKLMVEFEYRPPVRDDNGNIMRDSEGEIIRGEPKTIIYSQDIIINKLTSLFTLKENASIMERVDAIHFIVTKADVLGDLKKERLEEAKKLLLDDYGASISQVKDYVWRSQRINRTTEYKVKAFTFSLGRFYLDDIFELNQKDTIDLISVIRDITIGKRELTWWDKIKIKLGR